jgi:hypothetical protein
MAIHDHNWLTGPLVPWEPDNAPEYVIAVYAGGYTYKAVLETVDSTDPDGGYTYVGYAETPQDAVLKALAAYISAP